MYIKDKVSYKCYCLQEVWKHSKYKSTNLFTIICVLTKKVITKSNSLRKMLLIRKCGIFKMEDDEDMKTMFLRFQILVFGLKVLNINHTIDVLWRKPSEVYQRNGYQR